jgi:hypothetical protein
MWNSPSGRPHRKLKLTHNRRDTSERRITPGVDRARQSNGQSGASGASIHKMAKPRGFAPALREAEKNKSRVEPYGSVRKEEEADRSMVKVWRKPDRGKAATAFVYLLQQPQG